MAVPENSQNRAIDEPSTAEAAPPLMETPPAVELTSVSRDYQVGDSVVHALRSVDLRIDSGESIAIMGPSGSGKSTMMHLIGCLDTPTDGRIRIAGEDVSDMDEAELAWVRNEQIGFVFQQFNLLNKVNVLENVATPLLYAGVPSGRRKDLAREALDQVGLSDRLRHRPTELSGGQRQRVAIARALVTEPKIILADEPTGALDQKTGESILELFDQINRRGTTVIVVTHDAQVARRSRRLVTLLDGRIQEDRS
jgi:putative ABC transport system ATP-binding protein